MVKTAVFAVTAPLSYAFVADQVAQFSAMGYRTVVLTGPGLNEKGYDSYFELPLRREISLWKDVYCLLKIVYLLFRLRPAVLIYGTPKVSLLVAVAGWVLRVPNRFYTCHGLRIETVSSFWRYKILFCAEWLTAACSKDILCVSKSLAELYKNLWPRWRSKIAVVSHGSFGGVDCEKYNAVVQQVNKTRDELVPPGAFVIGFVGRFVKDKGFIDLLQAFQKLRVEFENAYLLLLGQYEEGDAVPTVWRETVIKDKRIINLGWRDDSARYYSLMDVMVLPSYREGLPTVLLEAAASGVPAVAYNSTGCVDVILDDITGYIVRKGDVSGLIAAVSEILQSCEKREQLSRQAVIDVKMRFEKHDVQRAYRQYYDKLLVLK